MANLSSVICKRLAFYDFYLWILNAEQETYAQSRNLIELRRILDSIADRAGEACLGVVYLPSKEHIYFPYTEPYGRRWILENGKEPFLDSAAWLMTDESSVSVEFSDLVGRLGAMQAAVGDVVVEAGCRRSRSRSPRDRAPPARSAKPSFISAYTVCGFF